MRARHRTLAGVVLAATATVAVPLAVEADAPARATHTAGGSELPPDLSAEVTGDAVVVRAADAPQPSTTALPATSGYQVLNGVTGYAYGAYTIVLADSPGVERVRSYVELAARTFTSETGIFVSIAPGTVPDRGPGDGEIVVRVSRDSLCGPLSSPGVAGCGGPRTSGGLVTRGEVWLAPEVGCDGRGVSTVVHELGHVFGLSHYQDEHQGLRQVMYPNTASGAPNFRAGDRAGLRALASHTVGQFVTEPGAADPVAAAPVTFAETTPAASPRIEAAPSAPSYFTRPELTRVLDTRNGIGLSGAFVPGTARTLDLSSYVGGAATAVALNLTTTSAQAGGYVTAYPTGTEQPDTSSANYAVGRDTANLVVVRLGPGSQLDLVTGNLDLGSGTVHVLADLLGVFSSTGDAGYVPTNPVRVYDTRTSSVPGERGFPMGCADVDAFSGDRLTAVGVPNTATAAVVNLTAADSIGNGFVSLLDPNDGFPSGPESATSNINVLDRDTRANLAISPGRQWYIRTSDSLVGDVVLDLAGYFVPVASDPTSSSFVATDPSRVLDTRRDIGLAGRFAPGTVRTLPVPVPSGIDPSKVTAVAINMTVAEASAAGYLTVAPAGAGLPNASNVNHGVGGAVPNLAIVKVGSGTSIDIMSFAGSPHVIGDVMGFFVRP